MQSTARGVMPQTHIAISPEQFAEGKRTVRMTFPKQVVFTPQHLRERVTYSAGEHSVPEEFADHWYLKANGAERIISPVTASKAAARIR
jgi:hypothetical protein